MSDLIMLALGFIVGIGVKMDWASSGKKKEEKARTRPVPLTAEELKALGSLDRTGPVARAVPHLCEALVLEAERELATAKPYGEGYAFAAARVAGRISAALELAERWGEIVEAAWREREREVERKSKQ